MIPVKKVILYTLNAITNKSEVLSSVEGGLKSISPEHHAVHAGLYFSHSDKHTVVQSAFLDKLIIPNSGSDLNLLPFQYNSTHGPDDVYLYRSPFTNAASLGTEITSDFHNHNEMLPNERGFTAYEDPFIDVNSLGQQLDYALMEQATGGAVKAAGGAASGNVGEWILDPTETYLVRFTNFNVAAATVKTGLSIYTEAGG